MRVDFTEGSWKSIENTTPQFGRLKAKRLSTEIDVLIGIDHNMLRHILVPITAQNESFTDQRSRGISVQNRRLIVEDFPESLYLDVTCNYKDANATFNLVISDIIELLHTGLSPNESVVRTLNKWRQFWSGGQRRILTEEQIKGLFGELWFLLFWLLPKGANMIELWSGPSGSIHDFENESYSVEVKTTSSIRGHIHKINGLDQLDPPESDQLFLYSLRLRREQTASNSLPTLIERINNTLRNEPVLINQFESKLIQAGYFHEFREEYVQYRYRIVDERMYNVNENFPKLTSSIFQEGVLNGIERIEYDINLEVCPDLVVSTSPQGWTLK
ncbi:PD-(D/E)XK motif protein [Bacillus sp. ISL-32]|nr:PD-(D/E)XK motif protein [Bacillus sp. ISL-32]